MTNPYTPFDAVYVHNLDIIFNYVVPDLKITVNGNLEVKNHAYKSTRKVLRRLQNFAQKFKGNLSAPQYDIGTIFANKPLVILNAKLENRLDILRKTFPEHDFICVNELSDIEQPKRAKNIFIPWDDSTFIFKGHFEDGVNITSLERIHDQVNALVGAGFIDFTIGSVRNKINVDNHILVIPRYDLNRTLQGNLKADLNHQNRVMSRGLHFTIKSTLQDFVDKHSGETAVILGNGPSLADVPPDLLNGKTVFGANQIYLVDEAIKKHIDYWFISDRLQMEKYADDFADKLNGWPVRKFIPSSYVDVLKFDTDTTSVFNHSFENPHSLFSIDQSVIYTGKTVIFVMCQAAAAMGFKKIIIVGMDHNYDLKNDAGSKVIRSKHIKTVTETFTQDNANSKTHFSEQYSDNRVFHMPNYDAIAERMKRATEVLTDQNIKIVNATPNSKLTTVPTAPITDFIT